MARLGHATTYHSRGRADQKKPAVSLAQLQQLVSISFQFILACPCTNKYLSESIERPTIDCRDWGFSHPEHILLSIPLVTTWMQKKTSIKCSLEVTPFTSILHACNEP
jgi:hypothetical protein